MKKLLLLLSVTAVLGSCSKKNDPTATPTALTKADLLVAKNWRISAQTAAFTFAGATTTQDEYASSPSCERDNFLKFNTNKTLVADEGATKCSSSDPQTQSGTWDFNSDYTKLTVMDPSQGNTPIPFDVVELTATTMHLRYTIVTGAAGTSATSVNDVIFSSF